MKGYFAFIFMLFILLLNSFPTASHSNTAQYCDGEFFEATCAHNEVIVIDRAQYGRMHKGRCVQIDMGLGCHADVISVLDQWCSGKQRCKQRVIDADFNDFHDCPRELDGYLEASYSCVQTKQVSFEDCQQSIKVGKESGSLLLSDLGANNCGYENSPLILEARPGQRLNLTLLDFTGQEERPHSRCSNKRGQITDLSNFRLVPICEGLGRYRQVMMSNGNVVKVTLSRGSFANRNLLLHYQVLGCPDMDPIDGAAMHRSGNKMTVECLDNSKSWELHCTDGEWIGTYTECVQAGNSETQQEAKAKEKRINISHELIVIVVGTVVLFVSGVIVCVGILHLCKRTSRKPEANYATYSYNPARQSIPLHTFPRHQIPDYNCAQQEHTWSRLDMPDVIDQTMERSHPPYPAPGIDEAIYENPGQISRGPGSCVYSSVHMENPDQPESEYSDSLKYYVLEQQGQDQSTL